MEHSTLHALQLCGIVISLGGTFFMFAIFIPACRRVAAAGLPPLGDVLTASVTRWVSCAACVGALASVLNVFVDVAEIRNRTIYGGVSLSDVWRFATVPTVGHFYMAQVFALLLTAAVVRLPGRGKWALTALFAMTAAVFTGVVSHAGAQPANRAFAISLQLIHITAASAWLGVLLHLLFARRKIESITDPRDAALLADIVRRFSPLALAAVSLLAVTGIIAAVRYLASPIAVPTSAYGLTLLVKLSLLVPLLYAGYVNFRFIRPALQTVAIPPSDGSPVGVPPSGGPPNRQKPEPLLPIPASTAGLSTLLRRFGKMLELEVTAGVLVVTVAGIVASISPPGDSADLRLSSLQIHALLTPGLPTTAIVNPEKFYGASERTIDDLRYAQFTHNWSGVMVTLLGLCWLGQSLGGRFGARAGKTWPFLLIPFALFIAVAADPEVWILRKVSLAQAFTDPSLIEHQIGAILVLVLVWLGWRDHRNPPESRPLGYALPLLMIFGSLLLLGHAHSNLTASQGLTNMINVEHAVFGTLGLAAGVIRWFDLRGLFPDRIARFAWPGCVIGLGLFMAFCYREIA